MMIMKISRDVVLTLSDTLRQFAFPVRESLSYLLFLILPASICGCNILEIETDNPISPEAYAFIDSTFITRTSIDIKDKISSLDVFTFNDDRLERLDSYQRFEDEELANNNCSVGTGSGRKRVIMLANSQANVYEWVDINCRRALEKRRFELEDEDPEFPFMIGDFKIDAGARLFSELERLTAEVVLKSIRCDFSKKSYAEAELTDVKIYLTNVNASCGIWHDENESPSRIINTGRLNMDDMNRFAHPNIIYREYDSPIGSQRIYPDITLMAYENSHREESIGTPYTKIVIEGKINGNTYYYPIAINRNGETNDYGIRRNMRYIYDITIRRTGLTDPDGSIQDTIADIEMIVEKWKELDWYDIRF